MGQEHRKNIKQTADSERAVDRVLPRARDRGSLEVEDHRGEVEIRACLVLTPAWPVLQTALSRAGSKPDEALRTPDERLSSLPTHPLSAMFTVACLLLLSAAHAIQLGAAPRGRGAQSAAVSSEVSSMPVSLDVLSEIQQTVAGQVTSCTWPLTAPDHSPST